MVLACTLDMSLTSKRKDPAGSPGLILNACIYWGELLQVTCHCLANSLSTFVSLSDC